MKSRKLNIYRQFIIIPLVCLVSLASCEYNDFSPVEWALNPELSFENAGVTFNSSVGTSIVRVTTNYSSFTAFSNASWCNVIANNDSSWVYIEVEPNKETTQRSATVTVQIQKGSHVLSKDIAVMQLGGIWDIVGGFNVYWTQVVSDSQKKAIQNLLDNLVYVEGGDFYIGDGTTKITLTSYYIGKYEVTQYQWASINAVNPSKYRGTSQPVENISWMDAIKFVENLSLLTKLNICLPTEAQWEFAARGGNKSLHFEYPGSDNPEDVAHYIDFALDEGHPSYTTLPVGSKQPNELGIYDMAGNVAEYCADWWAETYNYSTTTNPTGPASGTWKVVRGGMFTDFPRYMKNTSRNGTPSINYIDENTGFRIVLIP